MTTLYKVLGQEAPSATSPVNIYTVPSNTEAVISTIVVANRASSAGSFRLSVRPAGATQADQHYIAYDVPIGANDSTTLTIGITLAETDVITGYASSANMSFNVFGTEITP
jgi:hypothetical protein